jgi:hypothetical protein
VRNKNLKSGTDLLIMDESQIRNKLYKSGGPKRKRIQKGKAQREMDCTHAEA